MTAETDRYSRTRNNSDEMKTEVNSRSRVLRLGSRIHTITMGTWGYTSNATSTS